MTDNERAGQIAALIVLMLLAIVLAPIVGLALGWAWRLFRYGAGW